MDSHAGEPNFDRQSAAEKYRQEWKGMKLKKKAKWIKKAAENFKRYEDSIASFCVQNPGTVNVPTLQLKFHSVLYTTKKNAKRYETLRSLYQANLNVS
jgi:hypothetical protein